MSAAIEPEHLRAATERQLAIVRGLTPTQRLQQALRMNRRMRELLATGFRAQHPDWSDDEVKRAVAERILHAATG